VSAERSAGVILGALLPLTFAIRQALRNEIKSFQSGQCK